MIRQLFKSRRKQILVDVNTQKDFLLAGGNACIRNHRRVLANIRRVMAWVRYKHIPAISTCEVYPNHNSHNTINYCIEGTQGQEKIHYTILNNHLNLIADDCADLPIDMLRQYRQIILHNRCADPFEEPKIERLFSEVRANEFVLIGAPAEGAVEATVLGLLQRGKKVSVVVDAIGSHAKKGSKLALRKMKAKGAKLIETRKLAGSSHLKAVGACNCKMCRRQAEEILAKIGVGY